MFLGGFGAHRYYTGYIGLGILQLILSLFGIGAIWVFIDLIAILLNKYKDASDQPLINADATVSKNLRIVATIFILFAIFGVLFIVLSIMGAALSTMPHS